MQNKSIHINKKVLGKSCVLAWYLDFPKNLSLIKHDASLVVLQGWILFENSNEKFPKVKISNNNGEELCEILLNNKRPDVIEKVLHQNPLNHEQLQCGFNVSLEAEAVFDRVCLYVESNNEKIYLAELSFKNELNVLVGKDDWLFLDNDSNCSVDQYTGRVKLGLDGLNSWRDYLDNIFKYAKSYNMRHALVIAPSKEEVLPHRYPFQRAQTTVLDQVCTLAKPEWNVLNTAPILAEYPSPEACFKQTDTHWTDRGAMLAVMAVLEQLGLDARKAEALFTTDVYELRREVGDLGCKMLPAHSAETEFLQAPMPEQDAVFDNGLPNIGRALVFENGLAIYPWKMVIFGASSSYPMLKYLKRLFRRLVFVHSAAQVDEAVLLHEQPDFLLLQSNSRFLVQPPNLNFSLTDAVFRKTAEATSAFRVKLQEYIAENNFSEKDSLYVQMVSKALEKSIGK